MLASNMDILGDPKPGTGHFNVYIDGQPHVVTGTLHLNGQFDFYEIVNTDECADCNPDTLTTADAERDFLALANELPDPDKQ